ncbi:MAG: cell wall-associated NlpC family hydrolase [bacterium]|jgi:cell wall-associated NlpC family hydrolase
MKSHFLVIIIISIFLIGCSRTKSKNNTRRIITNHNNSNSTINRRNRRNRNRVTRNRRSVNSVYDALRLSAPKMVRVYRGIPYRWGTNPDRKRGADCSNLISAVVRNGVKRHGYKFRPYYINTRGIRRNSYAISIRKLRVGDLVFFRKGSASAQHAGVVTNIKNGNIYFFHASSSKGAMVSSTRSNGWKYYWKKRFHSFRRWKASIFTRSRS